MKVSDFHFVLPGELIAQRPLEERSASRLLHVRRNAGSTPEGRDFRDFPDILRPDDLVVLNNSRVFPARLIGQEVRVEVYEGRLQIFHRRDLLLSLPRAGGDRGAVIDYRHLIEHLLF